MLRHGGISIHISRTPLPCEDHTGTLFEAELSHTSGQASISPCPGGSGGRKVGNLGSNGAITFPNISVDRAGIYTLSVEHHSGTNTVTISGNTPWAPDIDRVIVR